MVMALVCGLTSALGELHWQEQKKEQIHVRLIALAIGYPRSTVFSTDEVFVAERQLNGGEDEWRMIKLVYEFLPYQPRLSDHGLDYRTVHIVTGTRDPGCDETFAQMMTRVSQDPDLTRSFKYSEHFPVQDALRSKAALWCYRTTASDYDGVAPEHEAERPHLERR